MKNMITPKEEAFLLNDKKFDKTFLDPNAPLLKTVSHEKRRLYLYGISNRPGGGCKRF